MTKKELEEFIKENLSIGENPELYPEVEYRLDSLEKAISGTKEYLDNYKQPYRHKFMGSTVKFIMPLIDELQIMVNLARTSLKE